MGRRDFYSDFRWNHDHSSRKFRGSRDRKLQKKARAVTPEGARKFIEAAETKLFDLWIRSGRAQWVHQTFITHDTEILGAQADQVVKATTADLAAQSNQYEHLKLPEDVARKIYLLKHSVDIPAPRDPAEQAELRKS